MENGGLGNAPNVGVGGNTVGAPVQAPNAQTAQVSSGVNVQPVLPRKTYSSRWALLLSVAALLAIVVVLFGVWVANVIMGNVRLAANSVSSQDPISNYNVTKLPLNNIPLPSLTGDAFAQLQINGQVHITSGLVLSTTSQPVAPVAGELYYDQTAKQPYYYDGNGFVSLKPGGNVTSIGGLSGNVALGNGLVVANGQLVAVQGQSAASPATPSPIDLQSSLITGVLPLSNGGTGSTALTANGIVYGNGAGALQATAAANNSILATNGSGLPSLTQTLPVVVQQNITATGALAVGSIVPGFGAITTSNNIMTSAMVQAGSVVVGADGGTPPNATVRAGASSGDSIAGANFYLDASNGTGTAGSGSIIIRTAPPSDTTLTFDAEASVSSAPVAGSLTWSHTTTANSNRILIVGISESWDESVSSVTYAGVNLTKINALACASSSCKTEMWYLFNPASGAHNVVVTFGFPENNVSAGSSTYYNVDPLTPIGTAVANSGAISSPSTTVTSAANQIVVDATAINSGQTWNPGAGQTQLYQLAPGGIVALSSYKPAVVGTTTTQWTAGGGANWAQIAVPINQVANTTPDNLTDRLSITKLGNVGIGTTSPAYALDVQGGDINTSGVLRIGGANINAAGTLSNVAYLNQDNTFRSGSNSTTAFQIQNASGTALLTADTTNMAITVAALTVTGTLTVNGHIVTTGSAPGIVAGVAACTSPTVGIVGNDTSGTITITTGTGCAAAGQLATITFNTVYGATPRVLLTPGSSQAAVLQVYRTATNAHFIVSSSVAPADTTTYTFDYFVSQ